uniref:Thioredoxin domain-containing protein n=1 Tax=Chrysotila carterae TaxID=13221 RepID=A0A7S4F7N4_CHRCT
MSKSDLSLLNAAAGEITQEALIRNVNNDLQAEAAVEEAQQAALAAAAEKQLQIDDDNDDDFDDFANDPEVQSLQEKRLAALKARYMEEKAYHMQGHGEYREIVEEEFLKEVCASDNVVVHFYHNEFFRCKVIDKHMRVRNLQAVSTCR